MSSLRAWSSGVGCAPRPLALAAIVLAALPAVAWAHNYLLIIGDDVGVDKVGAWRQDFDAYTTDGVFDETEVAWQPSTPTLDALADGGLRFTRAWASPVCSPTRASLNTGMYPFRSGVGWALDDDNEGPDWASYTMLGEAMQAGGFDTGLFGKWHLGLRGPGGTMDWTATGTYADDSPPSVGGYERFYGSLLGAVDDYYNWTLVSDSTQPHRAVVSTQTGYATDEVTQAAVAWINGRTAPWFAVVAYHSAHSDRTRAYTYDAVDVGCVQTPELAACVVDRTCDYEVLAAYQALVECLDTNIGDLLDGIDPATLDDTVVVFMGDNGTPAEAQEWHFAVSGGKTTVREPGIRVPLIVADGALWSGSATSDFITGPGREVDLPVSTMDIYQTLVTHGVHTPVAGVDSVSFGGCFRSTDPYCGRGERTYSYTEGFFILESGTLATGRAAVSYGGDYKLYVDYNATSRCLDDAMYQISTDFFETNPVTAPAATLTRLRTRFSAIAPAWSINPSTGRPYRWCP